MERPWLLRIIERQSHAIHCIKDQELTFKNYKHFLDGKKEKKKKIQSPYCLSIKLITDTELVFLINIYV